MMVNYAKTIKNKNQNIKPRKKNLRDDNNIIKWHKPSDHIQLWKLRENHRIQKLYKINWKRTAICFVPLPFLFFFALHFFLIQWTLILLFFLLFHDTRLVVALHLFLLHILHLNAKIAMKSNKMKTHRIE